MYTGCFFWRQLFYIAVTYLLKLNKIHTKHSYYLIITYIKLIIKIKLIITIYLIKIILYLNFLI